MVEIDGIVSGKFEKWDIEGDFFLGEKLISFYTRAFRWRDFWKYRFYNKRRANNSKPGDNWALLIKIFGGVPDLLGRDRSIWKVKVFIR